MMNSNFCARSITVLNLLSTWVLSSPMAFSYGGTMGVGGEGKTGSHEVIIDAATAQSLGIKAAPVQRQKLPVEIVAAGQIELLPNQKVAVTSPIKGKILQLLVQPGAKVKTGQAVATMTSPEWEDLRGASPEKKSAALVSLQQAQADLQLAQEGYRRIEQIAKADREQALSQLATAQARLNREQQLVKSGSVIQTSKNNYQRQQQISKAEISAAQYAVNFAAERYQADLKSVADGLGTRRQVLESQARLAAARAVLAKALQQSALSQAAAELRKAENELPRQELRAAEQQVAAAKDQLAKVLNQKSLIEADRQLRKAKAAIVAAQNRQNLSTTAYNGPISQLGNIDNQNGIITIRSPIDGTVVDRMVVDRAEPAEQNRDTTDQSVPAAGAKIMTITDDQQVLAQAKIHATDLARIKVGQEATIKFGSNFFKGAVSHIGTPVEEQSRVVPVQVAINNSGGSLKSGTSVELRLMTDESMAPAIAVPTTSIVEADGKKIVYVQNDNTYQAVNVELGETVGDLVEVKSGLFAGDQVVTQQATRIYTQSLKAPVHNLEHVHQAGFAQAFGWKMPSFWWLAIPSTLLTGGGAWWLMKKLRDGLEGVEEALQVEMIMENAESQSDYDFEVEAQIDTDIQAEVTEIEEIIENDPDESDNYPITNDRVLINPVKNNQ